VNAFNNFCRQFALLLCIEGVIGVVLAVVLFTLVETPIDAKTLRQRGIEIEASVIETHGGGAPMLGGQPALDDPLEMHLTVSYVGPDNRPAQVTLQAPAEEYVRHHGVDRNNPGKTTVVVHPQKPDQVMLKAQLPHAPEGPPNWVGPARLLAILMAVSGLLGVYGLMLQAQRKPTAEGDLPDADEDAVLYRGP